jgi:hypothetical protein
MLDLYEMTWQRIDRLQSYQSSVDDLINETCENDRPEECWIDLTLRYGKSLGYADNINKEIIDALSEMNYKESRKFLKEIYEEVGEILEEEYEVVFWDSNGKEDYWG